MKLIRIKEVVARTGRPRSCIYEDVARRDFPQPVRIGGRAIAFVEAEVEAWIAAKIAARDRVAA